MNKWEMTRTLSAIACLFKIKLIPHCVHICTEVREAVIANNPFDTSVHVYIVLNDFFCPTGGTEVMRNRSLKDHFDLIILSWNTVNVRTETTTVQQIFILCLSPKSFESLMKLPFSSVPSRFSSPGPRSTRSRKLCHCYEPQIRQLGKSIGRLTLYFVLLARSLLSLNCTPCDVPQDLTSIILLLLLRMINFWLCYAVRKIPSCTAPFCRDFSFR